MLTRAVVLLFASSCIAAAAQQSQPPEATALTIYNENFAVVRTSIALNLQPGVNDATTTQVTTELEPDSVLLRDPAKDGNTGHAPSFRILEQNYDAGVVTQEWLLQKFEGQTIDFQIPGSLKAPGGQGAPAAEIVQGKIIRAGGPLGQALVEVDGKLRFQLPGLPLFPASTDGLLLKPALHWQIESSIAQSLQAELAYMTGGLSWQATYNVVAPEANDVTGEQRANLLGWVTIHNDSGTEFPAARIKLMAGDVAKITPENGRYDRRRMIATGAMMMATDSSEVTQKAFDDFHLYDLHRSVALRDGETKQVQFLNVSGVTVTRSYRFDGASTNNQPNYGRGVHEEREFGFDESNNKVSIVQEIENKSSNHLGMPLPSGRLRLYRRDSDGQIEFIGESLIPHTPAEDKVKIVTGNAFDIKGKRTQTDFHLGQSGRTLDETIQVTLTNQKAQPVTATVVEHMNRGENWQIQEKSAEYTKTDSHTLQFPIQIPAKCEATLTYSVRYTW
jgi:hypothetical protein